MADSQHTAGIKITGDASGAVAAGKQVVDSQKQVADQFGKTTDQTKKNAEESRRFVERLKEQAETLGKTRAEIERYKAGQLQLTDAQKQSVSSSLAQVQAFEKKQQSLEFVRRAATVATAAILAYGTATVVSAKNTIDQAAALHNISQTYGVSTQTLSAYRYQMSLASVSQEEFNQGMKFLAKNISEARGGVGDGAALFRLLGKDIESAVQSGASIEALLPRIADRFASFADGPNKAALAVALFGGRLGEQLIPELNKGAAGFREAAREAEQFKQVFGPDMARRSEEFNTNLARMNALLSGSKVAIVNDALPALNRYLEQLIEGARIAGGFGASIMNLGGTDVRFGLGQSPKSLMDRADSNIAGLQKSRGVMAGLTGYDAAIANIDRDIALWQQSRDYAAFLQRQQAMRSLDGIDAGDQVSRMAARTGRQEAPALPKTGATGPTDYARISAQVREMAAVLALEEGALVKVTAAERALAQLKEARAAGLVKLTDAQYAEVKATLEGIAAKERDIAATEAMRKTTEDFYREQARLLEQEHREIRTMEESNKKLRESNEEIGLTAEQLAILRVRRAEDAVEIERQRAALIAAHPDQVAELELARQRVQLAEEHARLVRSGQGRELEAARAKKAEEEWQRTADNIERSLTDAIMRGFENGKGFIENFKQAFINAFKTALIQPVIAPIVRPVAGMMAGVGQGIANSIFGGGGGAGGMFGGLGSILTPGGGIGGWMGGGAAAGSSAAAISAAGGMTSGSYAALAMDVPVASGFSLGAALPWIGGGLLAASALGLFESEGDAQRTGNWIGGLGERGRTTQNRWFSEDMNAATWAFMDAQQAREQNLIRNLNLAPGQIGAVNSALAGTYGRQYGFGMEHTPVESSGAFEAIQAARLQAIASALGRSMEELNAVMQMSAEQWEAALEQMRATIAQSEAALGAGIRALPGQLGITDLQKYRDSLAVSDVNAPLDRLSAARRLYEDTLGRANAGDLDAVRAFPQVAQQLLGIGRETYASGGGFQDLFREVNRSLSDVLERQQALQLDILKDVPTAIQEASVDQITELKRGFNAMVQKLDEVNAQLRRMEAA